MGTNGVHGQSFDSSLAHTTIQAIKAEPPLRLMVATNFPKHLWFGCTGP